MVDKSWNSIQKIRENLGDLKVYTQYKVSMNSVKIDCLELISMFIPSPVTNSNKFEFVIWEYLIKLNIYYLIT